MRSENTTWFNNDRGILGNNLPKLRIKNSSFIQNNFVSCLQAIVHFCSLQNHPGNCKVSSGQHGHPLIQTKWKLNWEIQIKQLLLVMVFAPDWSQNELLNLFEVLSIHRLNSTFWPVIVISSISTLKSDTRTLQSAYEVYAQCLNRDVFLHCVTYRSMHSVSLTRVWSSGLGRAFFQSGCTHTHC